MRVLFAFWKRLCYNVRRIHMAYERGERLWMPSIPITPPFSCMLTNTGFLRTGGIPAQWSLTRWFAMLFPGERSSLWGIHRMMSGRTMSFTFRREVYCPAQPKRRSRLSVSGLSALSNWQTQICCALCGMFRSCTIFPICRKCGPTLREPTPAHWLKPPLNIWKYAVTWTWFVHSWLAFRWITLTRMRHWKKIAKRWRRVLILKASAAVPSNPLPRKTTRVSP